MPLITMKGGMIGILLGCTTMVTTIANGVSLGTSGGAIVKDTKCGFVIGMVMIRMMITTCGPTARTEEESGSGTAMTILGWLKKTLAILTDMLAGGLKTRTEPSWTSITNIQGGICGK